MREAGVKVRESFFSFRPRVFSFFFSGLFFFSHALFSLSPSVSQNPQVLTVRDILSYGVRSHMGARVDLELLAMRALSYTVAPGSAPEEFDEADRAYLSDDYKRRVLEHMSINQLIDTILINPTVQLSPSRRDTGFTATYSFQPLSNLVYTRDQQVSFFFAF